MATRIAAGLLWLVAATAAMASPVRIDPTPAALAEAMRDRSVVLLGEVHDNGAQHALRLAALQRLVEGGARPAIAFEQFDREHQSDIDRARRQRPRDADYLIAQAQGDSGWQWQFYRPFVALALEYDLPIVAANLSRHDAMRVATDDWRAIFDAKTIGELKLDRLPAGFRHKQEEAIAIGHCGLLPRNMLPSRARAQIARDIVMARSIQPYVNRGVVLLAGNGHVRRDIGIPFWLSATNARRAISIGVLERDDNGAASESVGNFDVYVITEPAEREDPCRELRRRERR